MLSRMDASSILEHIRPMVIWVDGFGAILEARGGAGGFHGWRPDDLTGRNVLELAAPSERQAVATFFVESADESLRTVPMPMPFRTRILGRSGDEHDIDVIATGVDDDGVLTGWVGVLVSHSLQSSVARPLNAELAGEPRDAVRRHLCDELGYDNDWGFQAWFLVELDGVRRVTGPTSDHGLAAAVREAVAAGWSPWADPAWARDLGLGGESLNVDPTLIPETLVVAADPLCTDDRSLRMACIPVVLDGEVIAAYLKVGCLPPGDDHAVSTNANARIASLVDVTRLLAQRWRDRDRLVAAATRDSLTGLANRDVFGDALRGAGDDSVVLYIDVDDFKQVNDRWGHAVGDRVLAAVAERIAAACRPQDLVARFGGDEFVVLLNEVDPAQTRVVGERILASVAEPFEWDNGPSRVTLSVGLARVQPGVVDAIDAADRAMLTAKRQGRDRVVAV